ncbi:rab GDP dissociation inhibitor beta-like [Trichosurus vulpecula]|uniref:rab GDP dissociation inhibitor beta-like n=1 Tax=Trichosurus vulpecula TaxID=9337 RepID=UPI00186B3AC0|nr:rab GDP dissociation inhibitor beta-like [Trichosurus vulpecula]
MASSIFSSIFTSISALVARSPSVLGSRCVSSTTNSSSQSAASSSSSSCCSLLLPCSSSSSSSSLDTVASPPLPRHSRPPPLPRGIPRPPHVPHCPRRTAPAPAPPRLPPTARHHHRVQAPAAAPGHVPLPHPHRRSTLNKDYDVIILGTGLKECVLGSLLASLGKKVLHVDRSARHGGESASLSPLDIAYRYFDVPGSPPATMGCGHAWKLDLLPKFLMAGGQLMKILTRLDALRFLDLRVVDASFLYKSGRIHKVPATESEALTSGLMGLFEKRRFRKFFLYALNFDQQDPRTHEGVDPLKTTVRDLFGIFDFGHDVRAFAGHVLALSRTNSYLDHPCLETLAKIQLYALSLAKNGRSPYLYPRCGIGELAQAFGRLTASRGGVFLMNTPVDDILVRDGRVVGIRSKSQITGCSQLICDPSYAPGLVRRVGQVIRAICILGHPVRNTDGAGSGLVIIPCTQTNRRSDIYVFLASSMHDVAPQGKYIAIVSTAVESTDPEREIQPALELLEPIEQKFFFLSDLHMPNEPGTKSQIFVTTSYDATANFESACHDIKEIYRKVTGSKLNLD